jgi:hypothetical protein
LDELLVNRIDKNLFLRELFNIGTVLGQRCFNLILFLIFGYFVFFVHVAVGQQELCTNRNFILKTVDELAQKTIQKLHLEPGARIVIHDGSKKEALTIQLGNHFIKHFLVKGIQVYTNNDSIDADFYLSWLPFEVELNYQNCKTKNESKLQRVQRNAKVGLSLRAEHGNTGEVLWVDDLFQWNTDTVLVSDLDRIEQGEITIKKPRRPVVRGIRDYLEPALVLSAVCIVTYLFYTVRSK